MYENEYVMSRDSARTNWRDNWKMLSSVSQQNSESSLSLSFNSVKDSLPDVFQKHVKLGLTILKFDV